MDDENLHSPDREKRYSQQSKQMHATHVAVVSSILTTFAMIGIGSVFVYTYRAEIFTLFANQYFSSIQGEAGLDTNEISHVKVPELSSQESQIISVVEKSNPAVVSIVITKDVPIIEKYYENYSPFNDFFGGESFGREFGFQIPQYRQNGTEKREVGGGTGFIVSKSGLIVTNKHVVSDDEASYTVLTNEGEKFDVELVAKDTFLDVAVLRISNTTNEFPFLTFGNSETIKQGQTVIAIGNALAEFRNSVSVGVISGLSRSITAGDGRGMSEQLDEVIQTDAAINPGNSGGPLLNLAGEVIGMNVAVASAENIGFALPARVVHTVVESVEKHGEIVRPYIGVRYVQITESLKKKNNLSVDYGALVIRGETAEELAVIPGSPADKGGIVENDIILEIDGVKLTRERSLGKVIRDKKVGETVSLHILHKGEEKTLSIVLEKAPK